MNKIAFIGLGNMGGPMALNLLTSGYDVVVYDVVHHAVQKLALQGAIAAESPQQAVANAAIVITMLPAAEQVKSLYLGNAGIINHAKNGALFIDCSTIDVQSAQLVGNAAIKAGYAFIDAPVSGGVAGAAAATLTFIMGGEVGDVNRAKPVLSCMGSHLCHAGALGAGQIAKLCNNMLLSVLMTGTSEALHLAMANGLDPHVISEIMLQSSGCNWALQRYNPCPGVMDNVPSSHNYEGGFMVKLMNKDLNLAMDAAQRAGVATPMAAVAQSLYRLHQSKGNAERDFSSIFELIAANQ